MPTMPDSASAVSTPLCSPNVSASPSVTRNTPPSLATSSPNTSTRSSAAIVSCRARLIACAIVRVGTCGTVVSIGPRGSSASSPCIGGRSMICVTSHLLRQLGDQLFALARQVGGYVVVDRVEHLAHVEVVGTDDRLTQFGSQSLRLGRDPLLQPLGPDSGGLQESAVTRNGIEGRPVVDFLIRPVPGRVVGGGVWTHPIRDGFDQRRPAAVTRPLRGLRDHRVTGQHVVAVDADTRHAVADSP